MKKTVVELFAGVGGFRVGLENLEKENISWKTVMADQWEPGKKPESQFAYKCYDQHYNDTNSINLNKDISQVKSKDIPNHSLLVGGFPCQDYSVASTGAKGIEGKKGVLWWEIYRIAKEKKPSFILLENVDRLLKSPTNQRGRDFAIMLKCLDDLKYNVEWRVINAADYGHPQRRRRVFIFAYKQKVATSTNLCSKIGFKDTNIQTANKLLEDSFFNRMFPAKLDEKKVKLIHNYSIKDKGKYNYSSSFEKDLQFISDNHNEMFRNSGVLIDGHIFSFDPVSTYTGPFKTLGDILVKSDNIPAEYFLNESQNIRMDNAKGAKKIERITADGHKYNYSEGQMSYPERTDVAGRTMLTSEGTINRSTHVVEDPHSGNLRFLLPIEAERLNEFPDNWTIGMTKRQRFFCMGNALVTGLISDMGREISNIIDQYNEKKD